MTTNPNIRFAYIYRDASNYKQHGEVIFSNETQLTLEEIEKQIRASLSDGEFFIARQIHLTERFFDALYDDDHPWHEFVSMTATDDPALTRNMNTNATSLHSYQTWSKPSVPAGMR